MWIVRLINWVIRVCKKNIKSFKENSISDAYHTFGELYEFRKVYHAALFNEWFLNGMHSVHKSFYHHDGEKCFGSDNWFIVSAMLPDGLISNHYKREDWDLFKVEEVDKALFEFDGHTGKDVLERVKKLIQGKPIEEDKNDTLLEDGAQVVNPMLHRFKVNLNTQDFELEALHSEITTPSVVTSVNPFEPNTPERKNFIEAMIRLNGGIRSILDESVNKTNAVNAFGKLTISDQSVLIQSLNLDNHLFGGVLADRTLYNVVKEWKLLTASKGPKVGKEYYNLSEEEKAVLNEFADTVIRFPNLDVSKEQKDALDDTDLKGYENKTIDGLSETILSSITKEEEPNLEPDIEELASSLLNKDSSKLTEKDLYDPNKYKKIQSTSGIYSIWDHMKCIYHGFLNSSAGPGLWEQLRVLKFNRPADAQNLLLRFVSEMEIQHGNLVQALNKSIVSEIIEKWYNWAMIYKIDGELESYNYFITVFEQADSLGVDLQISILVASLDSELNAEANRISGLVVDALNSKMEKGNPLNETTPIEGSDLHRLMNESKNKNSFTDPLSKTAEILEESLTKYRGVDTSEEDRRNIADIEKALAQVNKLLQTRSEEIGKDCPELYDVLGEDDDENYSIPSDKEYLELTSPTTTVKEVLDPIERLLCETVKAKQEDEFLRGSVDQMEEPQKYSDNFPSE